ncbi:MAG: hypothetical protein ACI9XB_004913 [Gammaproteobacteria bacterium]
MKLLNNFFLSGKKREYQPRFFMKFKFNFRNSFLTILLFFVLFGCSTQWYTKVATDEVREQDLGGFPYHPLVYHLDLSILAYQLYGQSLVWPFDPYYEESDTERGARSVLMDKVHAWTAAKGEEQVKTGMGINGYRGPGILNGFENNLRHDPILYRYDQIYPWSSNLTNPLNSWTEYLVPKEITAPIKDVYVCYRKVGKPVDSVAIEKITTGHLQSNGSGRDVLFAIEGGTGNKGIAGQSASQSLMGFVLMRYYLGSSKYDIHIAFRGSRSGAGGRAALQALRDNKAKGNPDWITDLGYDLIGTKEGGRVITKTGSVSRGMTTCLVSICPNLFEGLKMAAEFANFSIPERIYVTGHSLGGGLAQVFVSAVLLGNKYSAEDMPAQLRQWPWRQMKLITFGAPRVGSDDWAKKLTVESLSSDFFSTSINPYDKNALVPTDLTILPRLTDPNMPSGFRVLIPSDPISSEKIPGGKHIGKTVYVNKPRVLDPLNPNFKAHEPANIRKGLFVGFDDSRIPTTSWRKRKMTDLNIHRDKSKKGTREEYHKLAATIEKYYQENGIYFDSISFKSNFKLFLEIYQEN